MNPIVFRVDAITEAAGKYNPDAVRNGNEDNVLVDVDLSGMANASVKPDTAIRLGKAGMLMVVADGMGGMNAGEVASQIAVDTVAASFRPEVLPKSALESPDARIKYMEKVIAKADAAIKADAAVNSSRKGMGSTIIMAWLTPDGTLAVSWLGDSRAYGYNSKMGLHLLSEDHSYVQQLVNNGLLTYEQSFDHPQNNVILKSLGDPSSEPDPQSRLYHVGAGDTVILCSDGLSGVLRDRPGVEPLTNTPYTEENIEDIVKAHPGSVVECRKALMSAAERGGWYDNVTIVMCAIDNGPTSSLAKEVAKNEKDAAKAIAEKRPAANSTKKKSSVWLYAIVALVIVAIAAVGIIFFTKEDNSDKKGATATQQEQTVGSEAVDPPSPTPDATPAPKEKRQPSATTASPTKPTTNATKQKERTDAAKALEASDQQNNPPANGQTKGGRTITGTKKFKAEGNEESQPGPND